MKHISRTSHREYDLRLAVELVTLAQDVRINTTSGDFPGHFVGLTQQI